MTRMWRAVSTRVSPSALSRTAVVCAKVGMASPRVRRAGAGDRARRDGGGRERRKVNKEKETISILSPGSGGGHRPLSHCPSADCPRRNLSHRDYQATANLLIVASRVCTRSRFSPPSKAALRHSRLSRASPLPFRHGEPPRLPHRAPVSPNSTRRTSWTRRSRMSTSASRPSASSSRLPSSSARPPAILMSSARTTSRSARQKPLSPISRTRSASCTRAR